MSKRYYRVIKDTPAWTVGAILENEKPGEYTAISDLWNTFEESYPEDYLEVGKIVENSPTFFERVYYIKGLGAAKYVSKKVAQAMHSKGFKEV